MREAGRQPRGGWARRRERGEEQERRARREWIEERLAALTPARPPRFPQAAGASPGARDSAPAPDPAAVEESAITRLAAALPELGSVFCAFGRYLGGRPDLLPEAACRELAAVPDRVAPIPLDEVRELLARGLAKRPGPAPAAPTPGALDVSPGGDPRLAHLDPEPLSSTLVWQRHRGRLSGGEGVVVGVVRPDLDSALACDLELLPLLGPALAAAGGHPQVSPPWLAAAVNDFAAATAAAADGSRQAAALAAQAEDAAASGLPLCAARVRPGLSSQSVLTVEELPGWALRDFLREAPEPRRQRDAADLAARLCQAWLRQACFGPVFPADLDSGDVRVQADGRLGWTGGSFAVLPAASKGNLWHYLLAAAADDPDRACEALIRELDGGRAGGGAALSHRLRQLVPFRDGGWGARDDLAGYLFLHWRCAAQAGYRPRPELVSFYRGLTHLAVAARELAPRHDALREGLEAARLTAGVGELTRLLEPAQVREVLGKYAAVMLAMPQRIDELLNLAAAGRVNVKVEVIEPSAERRRKDSTAVALAVPMAMAAVVLFARHLAAATALGTWVERVAAVLLGILGAFLLRGGRGRSGGHREP